jgi:hypothetical protein
MKLHERNTKRHEYEVQMGTGPMVFVGHRETAAIHYAIEALGCHLEQSHVRLYHTYPSPGPVRRYVGIVKRDGELKRAGY